MGDDAIHFEYAPVKKQGCSPHIIKPIAGKSGVSNPDLYRSFYGRSEIKAGFYGIVVELINTSRPLPFLKIHTFVKQCRNAGAFYNKVCHMSVCDILYCFCCIGFNVFIVWVAPNDFARLNLSSFISSAIRDER